ncbi:MAG TPA: hypothetical protein VLZ54_11150, partial [Arenibacter sp.]|nr:hypothetical protein [Arenibacter sp.]
MKFFCFPRLVILMLLIGSGFSCQRSINYDRPVDTWVFRSVMDQQPRMLTLALNKDLYVCYNLQSGSLY